MRNGFVYLDEALPGIQCDAKYSGCDNFTGTIVDGYRTNRVVGTVELACALSIVQARAVDMKLGLMLFDAYRPERAVRYFLEWTKLPEDGRTKARHYPNIAKQDMVTLGYVCEQSAHSRGSTVDMTLYDLNTGIPLDMGGNFDLMDISSHHSANGLSPRATKNRRLLQMLMEGAGFSAYENEWWHYTLKNEPYPDTAFDFPIE